MSNDLVVLDVNNQIRQVEADKKFAQTLMHTKHYQTLGLDGIMAVTAKARSLGMDVMYAVNGGLYYLNGKVGMPAEAMSAMIREKGHSIQKDKKSNDQICILHGKRADNGDEWTITFSVEHARKAGLMKNVYDKYTEAMLYNRAMSFLARQLFADVIKGCGYTPDEIKEIVKNSSDDLKVSDDIEEVKPVISDEQKLELDALLDKSKTGYKEKIMNGLSRLPNPITDLKDLPLDLYVKIKDAAILNAKPAESFEDEIVDATLD